MKPDDYLYSFANRVSYWPSSNYCRAYEYCKWPWVVRKRVSGKKLIFLCCVDPDDMEQMFDLSISEIKHLCNLSQVDYLHMNGVNVECLLIHGRRFAEQCDLVAAAQFITGYWVVSSRSRMPNVYLTTETCCLDNGYATKYWFVRDLTSGFVKEFCVFCNRKHFALHRRSIDVWYVDGMDVRSRTEFATGGIVCFDKAVEFSKNSWSAAWQELEHKRKQLKCLLKAKNQLRSLRKLLKQPSTLGDRKALKSLRAELRREVILQS